MDGEREAPQIESPWCLALVSGSSPWVTIPAIKWKPLMTDNPRFWGSGNPKKSLTPISLRTWSLSKWSHSRLSAGTLVHVLWHLRQLYNLSQLPCDGLLDQWRMGIEASHWWHNHAQSCGEDDRSRWEWPWLWVVYILILALPVFLFVLFYCSGKTLDL